MQQHIKHTVEYANILLDANLIQIKNLKNKSYKSCIIYIKLILYWRERGFHFQNVAKFGTVPHLGCGGHRFKSCHPD